MVIFRGGFGGWGGGGGGGEGVDTLFSLQEFDPLPTQRVPPLVLFKKSIFGDGRLCKKALWRQYILTLRGSSRQKNAIFLSKISGFFFTCFFKNLPAAQKIWPKQSLFSALGEL